MVINVDRLLDEVARRLVVDSGGPDKIEERLASLASMSAPALHDAVRPPDRPRSPPGWKPSQRLAAPPPAEASSRHAANKSPPYRSKVVVPGSSEGPSKAGTVTTERRTVGLSREARPVNRSPVGNRGRDAIARRPRSENVPVTADRQSSLQSRPSRAAGDSVDQARSSNTSGSQRDGSRQGSSRGL